jgi:hypothetical protein
LIKFLDVPTFIFSLAGRFSAPVAIFTGLLLSLPDSAMQAMRLLEIKNGHLSELWLGFIYSTVLFLCFLVKISFPSMLSIIGVCFKALKVGRLRRTEFRNIIAHLHSLSDREKLWIQFCLHRNQQTFIAPQTSAVAISLTNKGVFSEGGGSPLSYPFTFRPDVWVYLIQHKSSFITSADLNDIKQFEQSLAAFAKSFRLY